jgi:hypothetical protein
MNNNDNFPLNIEELANMEYIPRGFAPIGYKILENVSSNKSIVDDINTDDYDVVIAEEVVNRYKYLQVLINTGCLELRITEEGIKRLERHLAKEI